MVLDSISVLNFHGQIVVAVNMIFFWCWYELTDNRKKDILVLGEGLGQGLDYTTTTEKAKYFINFTESGKSFVLSLHYNENNSSLLVNAVKMYQFKQRFRNKTISITSR